MVRTSPAKDGPEQPSARAAGSMDASSRSLLDAREPTAHAPIVSPPTTPEATDDDDDYANVPCTD